jgi:hypothetical protein
MCVRRTDQSKGSVMKTIASVFVVAALAFSQAAKAQQPTTPYVFRSVVQPGTVIGARTFTPQTIVGNAVLNDAGEIAFVASESGASSGAVFTSHRIVARQGDVIDGRIIVLLPIEAILAINNANQVAYEAWYADSREIAMSGKVSGRAMFVDNHLASAEVFDARGGAAPFILTDDGRIVLLAPSPEPASPKAKPEILGRIRIKPPKDSPVTITPVPVRPNRPRAAKKEPVERRQTLFPMNDSGQIIVPVNFKGGGFLLLIGTPRERKWQASTSLNQLDDDPRFQRLSPDGQDFARKAVDELNKALEETRQQLERQLPASPVKQ